MDTLLLEVCRFVVVFFLFAVAGWCMEVTLKFIQFHRFINRGFLIGPYCPIYGWGAVIVTLSVGGLFGQEGSYAEVFLAGLVICGALEYFTSWYMEKMFHARWWDYSQKPMNLHGRIWMGNLLLFGAGSVIIVKWVDPVLFGWLDRWSALALEITAACIILLMIADNIVSHVLMGSVKKAIDGQTGDSTEEISTKVRQLLTEKGALLRRIRDAYPNAVARSRKLTAEWKAAKARMKAAEAEWKEARDNASQAAIGKLRQSGENWKKRLEEASARFDAARAELRKKEENAFGRRE